MTGANLGITEMPEYKLHLKKSNSTTLFDFQLRHCNSLDEDAEIMLDLIRQEDERGERPSKKLKQHMMKLTSSSRNIFNDKYTSIMRRIGDSAEYKSNQSLSSLFSSSFIREEGSTSLLDISKRSKYKKGLLQRQTQLKIPHAIVRSISDNSAMKHGCSSPIMELKKSSAIAIAMVSSSENDYQNNTRSSPNISSFEHRILAARAAADSSGAQDKRFGQFSAHSPHLLNKQETATVQSYSSGGTISFTLSDSCESLMVDDVRNSYELDIAYSTHGAAAETSVDHKIATPSKIKVYSEETEEDLWMQPGQESDMDFVECLPRLHKRHSIVQDIKSISNNVHHFLQRYKKPLRRYSLYPKHQRRSPPKTLQLDHG